MSNLCIGCGLCCDGTLFSTVRLNAKDDLAVLRGAGMMKAGDAQFHQPCAVFRDGCCSAYALRPSACSSYRCKLLKRFERGEVGEHQARAVIALALQLQHAARAARPGGEPLALGENDLRDMPPDTREKLMDLAALGAYLQKNFLEAPPKAPE